MSKTFIAAFILGLAICAFAFLACIASAQTLTPLAKTEVILAVQNRTVKPLTYRQFQTWVAFLKRCPKITLKVARGNLIDALNSQLAKCL